MSSPFVLVMAFLFMSFGWAQDSKDESVTEIQKVGATLQGIEGEVEKYDVYIQEIKGREKKVYDFKIYFSDLIAKVASDGTFKIQFQKNKRELDILEQETESWLGEAELTKEKLKDLITILSQTGKSYRENSKTSKGDERKAYLGFATKTNRAVRKLRRYQTQINNHHKFLLGFKKDTDKWKSLLVNKIKKGLDQSLLKWRLSTVYISPFQSIKNIKEDLDNILERIKAFEVHKFFQNNRSFIIVRAILWVVSVVLILTTITFLANWLKDSPNIHLDKSVANIINMFARDRLATSLITFFAITRNDLGALTFTNDPFHISFVLTLLVLLILWFKFGEPILSFFLNEVNLSERLNKKLSMDSWIIPIYIFTRTAQGFFDLDNDFLYLFNSLLLGRISYKFLLLCVYSKVLDEKVEADDLAVFLKSTKVFISLFAAAIFLSSILEIIGFTNLGRSIQIVVVNNVFFLALGWVFYQVFAYGYGHKRKGLLKGAADPKLIELFDFFKSAVNITFVISFILIFLKSWYNAIFIFADFWDISLFNIGDYRFTINKPVNLILCYLIIRLTYLSIIFSLESFILKKLNISTKHSANVASIIRYIFILIFISTASALLGMTYKNLVLFASALGVGIGFGLQNIVNNFLSGIILLFEQPIRVGDVIEVNGFMSTVRHIGIRSTIVESFDNSSIIIPNSEILSNKLTNWTLNDNIIAVKCEVGVAYGTNTQLVTEILHQVAKENENIINYPKTLVWFNEFGDSSLNFTLKTWINRPADKFTIHSSLMHEINRLFIEHQVTIPFPQRDVHFNPGEADPLRI